MRFVSSPNDKARSNRLFAVEVLENVSLDALLELVAKEEVEQFRRDKGHLQLRQEALEKELKEQPGVLKQIYEVRLARLTPVGMVYLWPSSR